MTLTQIKYVVETAKTGSISGAAANLFISQSVVSSAVSSIEKELGRDIFIRSTTGVSLSPFGKTIISYLSSIQSQIDQIDRMAGKKQPEPSMSLSVASISYPFVISACTKIFNRWKDAGIVVEHYDDDELGVARLVESRAADIGILRIWSCYKSALLNQLKSRGLQYFPLGMFRIGITVGEGSPLIEREENSVTTEDLKGLSAVVYRSSDIGPYSDIFTQLKIPATRSKVVTSSRAAIAEIFASTDCYLLDTILPHRELHKIVDKGLRRRTFPIRDTDIFSEIGWIKRKNDGISSVALEFVEEATDLLR